MDKLPNLINDTAIRNLRIEGGFRLLQYSPLKFREKCRLLGELEHLGDGTIRNLWYLFSQDPDIPIQSTQKGE